MNSKRLPYCYGAKVILIRIDAGDSKEVQFGGVVMALDADEAKDIAISDFASKSLPALPCYRVGGKFDFYDLHIGSDAGLS